MQTTIHGIVLLAANLTEQQQHHGITSVTTHSVTKHTMVQVAASADVYRLGEELEAAGATVLEPTSERLTGARDRAWVEVALLLDGFRVTVMGPMRSLTRVEAA